MGGSQTVTSFAIVKKAGRQRWCTFAIACRSCRMTGNSLDAGACRPYSSSGAHGVNGVQLGVIRDQTVGYVGFGSIESVS